MLFHRPKLASIFLLFYPIYVSGHIVNPEWMDEDVKNIIRANKFYQRERIDVNRSIPNIPNARQPDNFTCVVPEIYLKWATEVHASVSNTPILADLYNDGYKEVVVSAYTHFVEVLEGMDGSLVTGWPQSHQATIHGSPVLYDIDRDSLLEIVAVDSDANVRFFGEKGERLIADIPLPKLRMNKPRARRSLLQNDPEPTKEHSPLTRSNQSREEALDYDEGYHQDASGQRYGSRALLSNEASRGHRFSEYDEDDFQIVVNTPRPPKPKTPVSIFLEVDAHVYGTPTVADLRNQGRNELIVAVTWHFDEEDGDGVGANASRRARRPGMPKGKSDHHYLANGVVVVDLMTRAPRVKQLEMTTKSSHPGAYALGSPTVFDVDGDGHKEIILGTGLGSVYVLDDKLKVLKGWPVTMAEIVDQVIVADVNDDGHPEILASDARGSVAVFSRKGKELWERGLACALVPGPKVGDVDGDGRSEVVVACAGGQLHVLRGHNGSSKPQFPLTFPGTPGGSSSPLILRLDNKHPQMHIVMVSSGDALWVVDGKTACADSYYLGEPSKGTPVADDLDNDGKMEIVVATLSGYVYCFETTSAYHPLKAWPSRVLHPTGFTARHEWAGVTLRRAPHQRVADLILVKGETFRLQYTIVDKRPPAMMPAATLGEDPQSIRVPYTVTVKVHFAGGDVLDFEPIEHSAPGEYFLFLRDPLKKRKKGFVSLRVTDNSKFEFIDTMAVTFHRTAHTALKWLLALPVFAMTVIALVLIPTTTGTEGVSLPD